jgi:hypothetical protein
VTLLVVVEGHRYDVGGVAEVVGAHFERYGIQERYVWIALGPDGTFGHNGSEGV